MKGWALRETLLVVFILSLLLIFFIPKYSVVTKRAIAQEALRTIYLMEDVINEYYIQNGNFTTALEDINLGNINNISNVNFRYEIEGSSINNYSIFAYGKKDSKAEGMKVVYSLPDKKHYIEHNGRVIEKIK